MNNIQGMKSESLKQTALPVALSLVVGAVASPAFTFGTFVKTRVSAMVAAVMFAVWTFVQWRMFWAGYGIYPEAGATFSTLYSRTIDEAQAAALVNVIGVNIAWLITGVVARRLYDHHKQAVLPISMAASASVLLVGVQAYSGSVEAAYNRVSGIEVGKQQAMTVSRNISDAVVGGVAMTDREKLVVHYAQISAAKSVYTDKRPSTFDEYVQWVASSCEGQEAEAPLCDNQLLRDIRKQQVSIGL
jgi:hypothetical protein